MGKDSSLFIVHSSWIKAANFILALFLFFGIIGCQKRDIKNIDSKGTNIICFGDSITFGYGVDPDKSYPAVLAGITQWQVINAGVDGDTSTDGLNRINKDVLEKDPLLVVIEFGGNDFLKKIPKTQTAENVNKMIDHIHGRGSMVALLDISTGILLSDYHKLLKDIASERGAIFIPKILTGIITNPSMKSDFLHPNENGYAVIAQRVYRTIIPYLNRNFTLKSIASK
ncbi:MAG: hypothetical protein C4533_00585 [Candidatus Omnitrophota bacterium]|jgi:acyl-CoA thioesterase-1|nr:MAG: hypothetical protein C4533_00585 [Candidatus Omnitrophota bacterium]